MVELCTILTEAVCKGVVDSRTIVAQMGLVVVVLVSRPGHVTREIDCTHELKQAPKAFIDRSLSIYSVIEY